VIGPNVAYYLIEYLLSNFQVDSHVTALLQRREVIVTPMTNAVGYFYRQREELLNNTHPEYVNNKDRAMRSSFDINRDFPYNTNADQCLNTIAGRVIHQLYVENIFVSALTFHGGTNVIGYPWGSFNRVSGGNRNYKSKETPDFQALESVGWVMKNETGSNIRSKQNKKAIKEYIFGDISSTIYPVNGGLEDWGYGAGWDEDHDATRYDCKPRSYLLKGVSQSK